MEPEQLLRICGIAVRVVSTIGTPAGIDYTSPGMSRRDQLIDYHKRLVNCSGDLVGTVEKVYSSRQLQYWFAIASGLTGRLKTTTIDWIFELDHIESIPKSSLHDLNTAYEQSVEEYCAG